MAETTPDTAGTGAPNAPTLEAVRLRLLNVYTPEGALVWLVSPHKLLDGQRAADVIEQGRGDEVLALVEQMETGAAT